MKKSFSIAVFLLVSILSFAGDTTIVQKSVGQITQSISDAGNGIGSAIKSVVPDSATLSFAKVYGDVKAGISALASSLKVGAEHVYYILVRQQVVYSVTYLTIILILVIAATIGYREARKAFNGHQKLGIESIGEDNMRDWEIISSSKGALAIVLSIATIALSVACVIVTASTLDNIIMGLLNPEYGAIKDIISIVK